MSSSDSDKCALLDQLAEEFAQRYRRGERPALQEFIDRYPHLADDIRELLPALAQVEQAEEDRRDTAPPPAVPPLRQVGDYRIVRELGHGGMGVVYEAEQVSLGRRVALKILPLRAGGDQRALERFRREAKAAAQLHHTNIVPVFEVGQDGDHLYYAMQFIQGRGLDQVIDELRQFKGATPVGQRSTGITGGAAEEPGMSEAAGALLRGDFAEPMPALAEGPGQAPPASTGRRPAIDAGRDPYVRSVARAGQQAADALAHAHARGVVHRDIKPSNLILDSSGVVWVTDFGLAKTEEEGLTDPGDVVGTLRYMAPERFRGECDARADVYGLGLTLYELLTLRPAFDARDRLRLIDQIQKEEPPRPRRLDPQVPRDLESIVLKAIDKDPRRRYPTAAVMAEDLRRFLAGEPTLARPVSMVERLAKWVRRQPAQAALAALVWVALLAAVVIAVGAVYNRQLEESRDREGFERRRAEEYLYFHRIDLASQSWWDNNIKHALDLLGRCPPEKRRWEWHYLDRLCHPECRALTGHTDEVLSLAVRADGKLLASGSKDRTVRLWDADTGQEVWPPLTGHTADVFSVAFNHDGTKLVSAAGAAGEPGEVIIWALSREPDSSRLRAVAPRKVAGGTGVICQAAFSPDGRYVAVASGIVSDKTGQVAVFGAADGKEVWSQGIEQVGAFGLAFSPDGKQLASLGSKHRDAEDPHEPCLYVWDAKLGKEPRKLFPHCNAVYNGLAYSPRDGRYLAAPGKNGTIQLWETATWSPVRTLHGHRGDINSLAFQADGKRLASAADSDGGVVRVWDVEDGEELATLRGHLADVYGLAYLPDGRLATAGMDRTLRLWDASQTDSPEALVLRGHDGRVASVAFSPDGRRLASGGQDCTVRLWDSPGQGPARVLGRHDRPVYSVAFCPTRGLLASGAGDWQDLRLPGEVAVWDVETGAKVRRWSAHTGLVWSVAFSPDGTRLATGGGEWSRADAVKIWDTADWQQLAELKLPKGVRAVAFSPDGGRVAAAMPDGMTTTVWDPVTGEELSLKTEGSRPYCVAFSADGRRLLTGNSDQMVHIWDAATGQPLDVLQAHTSDVMDLAFSPDGRRLATGSWDQKVKVWDVGTGQELLTLRGHQGPLWRLAFSPDGHYLASCADDGTVRLWNGSPRP